MTNDLTCFFLNFRSGRNKDTNQAWARVEYATADGSTGTVYLQNPNDDRLTDHIADLRPFDEVTLSLSLTPSTKGWRAALVNIS